MSSALKYGSIVLTLVAIVGATYSISRRTPVPSPTTNPLYQPATAPQATSNGPPAYLGAVGIVEPSSELIAIGANASGVVSQVLVRPGDHVRQNDPLFVVDDRTPRAELEARRAELRTAEARLEESKLLMEVARAKVASAEASVQGAQVEADEELDRLGRAEELAGRAATSASELNHRRFARQSAAARLAGAQALLREARASLALYSGVEDSKATAYAGPTMEMQRSSVELARAAVALAETKLEHCTVRAPLEAAVLQVRVRAGEFAQAAVMAEPLMMLGDIEPLHVRAEIDEAEAARFDPRAPALASLRGRAELRAKLTLVRVEPLVIPKRVLTGSISERVDTRVLQVIYALDPAAFPARPGQQVDVYIEETASD